MKRLLAIAGIIALALVVAVAIVACGEKETTTTAAAPTTAPPSTQTTAAGPETTAPSTETTAAPTKTETVKFGVITSLTGVMAPGFKAIYDSVKPTQDLLNSKGGFTIGDTRYNIEIVAYDDQSSTAGAMSAINKLIEDGVKFLYPPMFMPNNLAINQLCEENKILRIKTFGAGADEVNPNNPFMFFANSGVENIELFYKFAIAKYPNVKKIAVITPDDPGGATYQKLIKETIAANGLDLVYFEVYPIGTEDYYPILNKALAAKPDAIDVIYGIPPWTSAIINQSRELGFTGPIFGPCCLGDPNIVLGMINNKEHAHDILDCAPDVNSDKMLPIVKELKAEIQKAGASWEMDSLHLLDAFTVLIQMIEAAQSLNTEDIVAVVDSGKMTTFETIYGPGSWGSHPEIYGNNHCGKKPTLMSIIHDGKVQFDFLQ